MQIMKDWAFQAPTRPMATILIPVRWYHVCAAWGLFFFVACGESIGEIIAKALW